MNSDIDISKMARDDLEVECRYLQQKCKEFLENSERDAQRIHELKRSLETANATKQYLTQELDQLTAASNATASVSNDKLQSDYDELRRKYKSLESDFSTMQEDYDALLEENTKLRCKLEQISADKEKNVDMEAQVDYEKLNARLQVLEQDNMELLDKLEEQRCETVKQSMLLAEKEKQIEVIRDEQMCLQENLHYKREELEEKTNLLESAQEQLCEANAKINMLMSAPENKDRKGNSLFAEVDDQRQAMIKVLAAQKKSYNEMKKTYNESQYEIRRLQRLNTAMHTELEACSSLFRYADRIYQEKLNARIGYLLNENEDLEKKLKRTHEHLKELASNHDVPWLSSMLDFCKKEATEFKTQLHSVRIQNASLEEQVRNLQQDLARWRFEALKSRCLIIDRENLLSEHKIAFKPKNSVECNITDEEIQQARPRIIPIKSIESHEIEKPSEFLSNKEFNVTSQKPNVLQMEESLDTTSKSVISINDSIDSADNENNCPLVKVNADSNFKRSPLSLKRASNQSEISPKLKIKTVETLNKKFQEANVTESLPSILCKNQDFLTENAKKVQFDVNEATVCNLSANLNGSDIDVKNNNSMDVENNATEEKGNSASTVIKTVRTKSNVLVRQIIFKSKPK